jgi:hypothetical protein
MKAFYKWLVIKVRIVFVLEYGMKNKNVASKISNPPVKPFIIDDHRCQEIPVSILEDANDSLPTNEESEPRVVEPVSKDNSAPKQ